VSPGARKWSAWGMTLLAAFASIATTPASEFEAVELPTRVVVLDADHPEASARFRVKSDNGEVEILLSFETAPSANPTLSLVALDGTNGKVLDLEVYNSSELPNRVERRYSVDARCPKEFPCVLDFEATFGADLAKAGTINGILSIAAEFAHPGDIYDRYLAIDPL
jgi:hypothetical protein